MNRGFVATKPGLRIKKYACKVRVGLMAFAGAGTRAEDRAS